ncbi:YlaH-like protein [Thalassobacillus cyri]|uniref:YlaH-like protein n=1 Tax=Thalassobacillus cyri TaxID=571932 RepID=A0A1H4GPN5_9BACI|nr:YlaH-like family protein [Thalassobacillus cyri]SEB11514.1 YlaH-like protein [Thalassobacillus cyri]
MNEENVLNVPNDLWPIADMFFQGLGTEVNMNNEDEVALLFRGFFLLYLTVVTLAIITFKLGFARKLPLLQNLIVYGVLVIGTFFLTLILGLNLPIAESLLASAIVLGIYRIRLHRERESRNESS